MPHSYNNRVLVIDDDEAILDIFQSVLTGRPDSGRQKLQQLQSLLQRGGPPPESETREAITFAVDTAKQGQSGFEKARRANAQGTPYAVIFVDMRMPPGWDGVQTIKAIRECDTYCQIVIVTAYSDASIEEIVTQVGFTDRLLYLKKPFDDQEILQLASSLAARWNLEHKVLGFNDILQGVVSSLGEFDVMHYENTICLFLKKILSQLSQILGTPDMLLAKVADGEIIFRVGLGRFANGLSKTDALKEIVNKALGQEKIDELIRMNEFVVLPLAMRSCQNVVIGVLDAKDIASADKLLQSMATSAANLFKQGTRLAELCLEVEHLKAGGQEIVCRTDIDSDDSFNGE